MKITHVVTSTNIGGAQIMLQRYLAALGPEAAQHEVVSLMDDGSIAGPIRETGSSVTSLGMTSPLSTLTAVRKLRAHLRRSAPEVVHGWMYHGCLAAWAGVAGRRPPARPALVWGIHHSLQEVANEKNTTRAMLRMMTRVAPGVDLITYCSKVSRAQHEAIGLTRARAVLIPNAVDTDVFRPDPEGRARLCDLIGVRDDRILIGNAARNHPMKDHVSMVRAIGVLRGQGHNVHGVMIGAGHSGSAAEAEMHKLGLSDRISMVPARDDIHALVPGFDLFLLSSAWGEAFPLAVCEAMACEVPAVATDVGDCAHLIGDTGHIVPPSDPTAQAAKLAQMIEGGPAHRMQMGKAARARVSALFSTPHYVEAHRAAYRQAIDGSTVNTSATRSADLARAGKEG
ncbi:glycosyltransferase [uncultured Tateyamaria sp.]|uniref:glycosyltransferase n=1 Tax=uncultured Tateyamaria sp. TaxID=455651 RepID=UPI002609B6D8|nr:glycosyltransferase [uncultured Tateyamaria sp.]